MAAETDEDKAAAQAKVVELTAQIEELAAA